MRAIRIMLLTVGFALVMSLAASGKPADSDIAIAVAKTKWAGLHLTAEERYTITTGEAWEQWEYWRDRTGRWRLATTGSSNPFRIGNVILFDGSRLHFYDARVKSWSSSVVQLKGQVNGHPAVFHVEASDLISPLRAVFTIQRANPANPQAALRLLTSAAGVPKIQSYELTRMSQLPSKSAQVRDALVIDLDKALVTHCDEYVDGALKLTFDIKSADYNTPMPPSLFQPGK